MTFSIQRKKTKIIRPCMIFSIKNKIGYFSVKYVYIYIYIEIMHRTTSSKLEIKTNLLL